MRALVSTHRRRLVLAGLRMRDMADAREWFAALSTVALVCEAAVFLKLAFGD